MMPDELQILWIKEEPKNTSLVDELCASEEGPSLTVEIINSLKQGSDRASKAEFSFVSKGIPHLLVLDLVSEGNKILEILTKLHSHAPSVPTILIGPQINNTILAEVIKRGAQEYLVMEDIVPNRFFSAITSAITRKRVDFEKSEILGLVSHELKTPIAIVKEGLSQVTEGLHGSLTDAQQQFLGITLEGIERVGRIVETMLSTARIEAGKLNMKRGPLPLGKTVRAVAGHFLQRTRKKGLDLLVNVPEPDVEAYADSGLITQVLVNLIGNAVKFTEKGRIAIEVVPKDQVLEVSVLDTGRGIAEADAPKVFDKFKQFGSRPQAEDKGLGLGLSIVKAIIELHDGFIKVESAIGKGSVFTFSLPKYSVHYALKDYVHTNLKDVTKDGENLSVIMFGFKGRGSQLAKDKDVYGGTLKNMFTLVRSNLRTEADRLFSHRDSAWAVLSGIDKQNAVLAAERIQKIMGDALQKWGMAQSLELEFNVISYPEDTSSPQEFLNKTII